MDNSVEMTKIPPVSCRWTWKSSIFFSFRIFKPCWMTARCWWWHRPTISHPASTILYQPCRACTEQCLGGSSAADDCSWVVYVHFLDNQCSTVWRNIYNIHIYIYTYIYIYIYIWNYIVYDYMISHYSSNVEVPVILETNLVLVLLDASKKCGIQVEGAALM